MQIQSKVFLLFPLQMDEKYDLIFFFFALKRLFLLIFIYHSPRERNSQTNFNKFLQNILRIMKFYFLSGYENSSERHKFAIK